MVFVYFINMIIIIFLLKPKSPAGTCDSSVCMPASISQGQHVHTCRDILTAACV